MNVDPRIFWGVPASLMRRAIEEGGYSVLDLDRMIDADCIREWARERIAKSIDPALAAQLTAIVADLDVATREIRNRWMLLWQHPEVEAIVREQRDLVDEIDRLRHVDFAGSEAARARLCALADSAAKATAGPAWVWFCAADAEEAALRETEAVAVERLTAAWAAAASPPAACPPRP